MSQREQKSVNRLSSSERRRANRRRTLTAEGLEDRQLLTTLFTPVNGAETAVDGGGAKLGTNGFGMPLYSIFWGSYWNTPAGQTQEAAIEGSLNGIFYNTHYLDALHQYGVPHPAGVPASLTVQVNNNSDPSQNFTQSNLKSVINNGISSQGLPDANSFSNEGLYVVFTPPGYNYTDNNDRGFHTNYTASVNGNNILRHYAWVGNYGGTDGVTNILSHEVAEAMSDPNGNGVQVSPSNSSAWNEIGDNEAQNYSEYLNGYEVQSVWSQSDRSYAVYDGNRQTVTVNNGTLTVNGDQLGAGTNDVVNLDVNSNGGVKVILNGETFSFLSGEIRKVNVNMAGGTNNVNILASTWSAPITVNGSGTDLVNVGYGNVSRVQGSVTVLNPPLYSSIYVDDSQDPNAETVTITDGSVNFSNAAPVYFPRQIDISALVVSTGTGANSVFVQSTASHFTTSLMGHGHDTVNVGDGNGLNDIRGNLAVSNPPSYTTLNLNDSNDSVARSATLSNAALTGLAPATISYIAADLAGLNVWTGFAGTTLNVPSTPYRGTTTINDGAPDTINVGNATDGVQDIVGKLVISAVFATQDVNIDDSVDTTARTATLSGSSITGLAPGSISYPSTAIHTLNLHTGSGGTTLNVTGTPSSGPTTLYGGGPDAVTVGNNTDGVQDVLGSLFVTNPRATTSLSVDDSADTTARTVAFDSVTGSDGNQYEQITGLAPAAISYVDNQVAPSANVYGGSGGNVLNVNSLLSSPVNLSTGAGDDTVNLGATSGSIAIDGGAGNNTLVGPNALNQWTVTGANAGSVSPATFANIENLTGGNAGNTFVFADAASVSGVITGGGADTLDLSAYTTPVAVNLAAKTATGTGGWTGLTSFLGGAASDTLVGPDTSNIWTLSAQNAGNVNGVAFSSFENLAGGAIDDAFVLADGAGVSGTIDGGPGNNALSYAGDSSPVTVNLANSSATGIGGVLANIQSFTGGAGSSTLVGPDTANNWTINSNNNGIINSIPFTSFGNLKGGAGDDAFQFNSGQGVAGTIDGAGGNNTVNYAAYTTGVNVNLAVGTATGTGGVANISTVFGSSKADHITGGAGAETIYGNGGADVLAGGGGADVFVIASNQASTTKISDTGNSATILGANQANVWTLTGTDAGNLNGIAFTGIANLSGNGSTDALKINAAGNLLGTFDGGAGANTLDYSSRGTTPVAINLSTGSSTGIHAIANIGTVIGGPSTNDTLTGPNVATNWTITGANTGTAGAVKFSGIENLTGGSGNDTFKFNAGGGTSGKVNGGGGSDVLNYSSYNSPVNVNLGTSAATATGGFVGISGFVGSSAASTLTGANTTNSWSINATNTGSVNAASFSGFGNLVGGTGVDVFKFANGKNVTGMINGNGGGDWIDESAYTTPVTINLASGVATGVGGKLSGVQDVRGGNGGSTLTGNSQGNILIGGKGAVTINGGSGRSILISDKGTGSITGGTGDDILIGGSTNFDSSSLANDLALEKLLAEWQSSNSYATRIANIKAGTGLTGGNKLVWGSTVHDESAVVVMKGNGGTNWFFKGAKGSTPDRLTSEQIN